MQWCLVLSNLNGKYLCSYKLGLQLMMTSKARLWLQPNILLLSVCSECRTAPSSGRANERPYQQSSAAAPHRRYTELMPTKHFLKTTTWPRKYLGCTIKLTGFVVRLSLCEIARQLLPALKQLVVRPAINALFYLVPEQYRHSVAGRREDQADQADQADLTSDMIEIEQKPEKNAEHVTTRLIDRLLRIFLVCIVFPVLARQIKFLTLWISGSISISH